ncbi:MAG: putative 7-carboxy-7-deazaguanine synthase QueE [Lachnospiraceae bacterium]|nr:putative 7-carboxy-7-deazaguanine synthase QueE [Lachnospiraceae bacterium]
MAEFKVAEIFTSINGEGMRAGELAVFIRLQGCNLRCGYCDTMWANEAGALCTKMTTEEILQRIKAAGVRNITLTGGEPLDRPDIGELIESITSDPWLRLEIETNGSIPLKPFTGYFNPPVFTMDYKLPGSGMESAMNQENFKWLKPEDTVKFVVSDRKDLIRAKEIIEGYALAERCHVILSPVFGSIEPENIAEFMKEQKLNDIRMQIQMHKVIWDPEQRGV